MELTKETIIEFIKKIGNKCESCGNYYVGAAIKASTEDGNYGIDFDKIKDYYIGCGKCHDCAVDCYNNLYSYVDEHGKLPCNDEEVGLEDIIDYVEYAKKYELIECYPYTYDFQDQILQYGSGHINAGCLIDLSEVILKKIGNISREEIDELAF